MRTYRLYRIETDATPLIGYVRADRTQQALDLFERTIRAQQVGTIMELRSRGCEAISLSNDISRYYVYPQAA